MSESAKYEVIRWPSAYCATSSGMDMANMRDNTQPALLSLVRTRLQSSMTGGFLPGSGAGASAVSSVLARAASSLSTGDRESSRQFGGSFGGGGMGGGGTRRD